jgi:hypothetical protein
VNGDSLDQLVQAVGETKDTIGHEIYVFAPPGRRFFLGETLLLAGSVFVLRAFFRGFAASSEGELEEWGREAYTWLSGRIRNVIESGTEDVTTPSDNPDLVADWGLAKGVANNIATEKAEEYAQGSQIIIQNIFIEQGLTSTQAERIAAGVRQAAMATLTGTN